MSPHRALAAGVVVSGALVAATLVSVLRPDAESVFEAARTAEAQPITSPSMGRVEPSPERGKPAHVVRYEPEQHGGHRQSWDVAQAPSGLVYVANSDGVLEYDGAAWRLIDVPGFRARAVTVGPGGVVHVGGEGTAGVLAPDPTGRMAYQEVVGDAELEGATVWAAVQTERGVLFQSFDRLLAVEDGRIVDVQQAPEGRRFHKAFGTGGAAYVRLEGTGLLRYTDRRLVPVAGGDRLADIPTRALLDLDGRPGGALLAVSDDELFRLDGAAAVPFVPIPTTASDALRQTRAYHGCAVGPTPDEGGALAITTMGGGVIVVQPDGHVVERLGQAAGLTPDDLVLGCTTDGQGGLWLALSDAVARIDAAAPLTAFDADLGLDGAIYGTQRIDGSLYAGTGRGVYRLRPSTDGEAAAFVPVRLAGGDVGQAWALLDAGDGTLLVSGTAGIVAVKGLLARMILSETAFSLASLTASPETPVYAGLKSGVAVLRHSGGRWTEAARVQGIDSEVRSVRAVEGGAWVAETSGRLVQIDTEGRILRAYDQTDGVPDGLASVQHIDGVLAVLAAAGPYHLDITPGGIRFDPMLTLRSVVEEVTSDVSDGYGVRADGSGRLWVSGRERTSAVVRSGDTWKDVTPPALRRIGGLKGVRAEGDVLWASTTEGLLRFDGDSGGRYAATVPARIAAIDAGGIVTIEDQAATLPYRSPVRFRFAAAAFNGASRTLYRTQLVGHDAAPSAWSRETFRDYTNLPVGAYAFRVEALTAQGVEARPATVAVHVQAPWYLTTWAALVAALLCGVAVAGVALAASLQQRRRADAEQGRAEAERSRANELDRLNAELRHADEVKDLMLANTSHELRTPLTAILGFSEMLAEGDVCDPDEVQEFARSMLSSGQRLLHTVNDLLDIARLRSGKVELSPVETDAAEIARRVVGELVPLATGKGIVLAVVPPGLSVPALLDPDAFARVITNLVSNGVKFTETGSVIVAIDAVGGDVLLDVTDTGCGMDAEFLPRLFDTFEQESTGYGRAAEGSGLGMAITARLVALMDGTIDVTSAPGKGTRFSVRVPARAEAFGGQSTGPRSTPTTAVFAPPLEG